jgi:hypothetical protein
MNRCRNHGGVQFDFYRNSLVLIASATLAGLILRSAIE